MTLESTDNILEKTEFGLLRAHWLCHRRNVQDDSINKKNFFSGSVGDLVHYTTLSGLAGIIESRGFWMSDMRFLNDAQEYLNGAYIAEDLLKKLEKKARHKIFKRFLEEAKEKILIAPEQALFVCSFSKRLNSLDHWRAYAKGASGVALVISGNSRSLVDLPIFHPEYVIYDDAEKIKKLIHVVYIYYREFKRDQALKRNLYEDCWGSYLAESLKTYFPLFKHSSFSSEHEIRLVSHETHIHHFKRIHHRLTSNQIIPYIKTSDVISQEELPFLPIREIHIGPPFSPQQRLTEQSVKAFLKNIGHPEVKIILSDLPYRG